MFLLFKISNTNTLSDKKFSKELLNKIRKLKNTKEEKILDEFLWKLRFNVYTKGTEYFKTSILICLVEESYLNDISSLILQLSYIFNTNPHNIRNSIDNSLNTAFKFEYLQYDIEFFEGYYDGRKVSIKYLINLFVTFIKLKLE